MHIIEHPAAAPQPGETIDTRANHLALEVEDLGAAKRQLETWQIPYHEIVNAGGIRQVFFHDPDGHVVEIAIYEPE
jgi:catechol 2,3-dioxygenase-like lactoylglutathione lyase family enzyme